MKSLILEIREQNWDSDSETESNDSSNTIFLNDYLGTGRGNNNQENPRTVGLDVYPSEAFKTRLYRYQEIVASGQVSITVDCVFIGIHCIEIIYSCFLREAIDKKCSILRNV